MERGRGIDEVIVLCKGISGSQTNLKSRIKKRSGVCPTAELVEKVTKQAGEKAPDARKPPEG